jgi:uncharacterized membrane protein
MNTLIRKAFKKYFLLGLIVIIPFAVTLKIFFFIIRFFDDILAVEQGRFLYIFPAEVHPNFLLGFPIPFLGIFFFIALTLFVGLLSRYYFGRRLIQWTDSLMAKIPMASGVYGLVKQTVDTYVNRDKGQFSKVVMVEYPRKGLYTVAFVTGEAPEMNQEQMLNVYVPTTPNPTSGFYLMVPEKDAKVLDLSVEDAFKLVVSFGMVSTSKHEA